MLDEIYLRLLLELMPSSLKLTGLDVRRLIEQFNDSSQYKRAYGELIKHIYLDDIDSDIGLRFGRHLHPSTLCDLSRALMTAPNFDQAIRLAENYHFIHGASYHPSIYRGPNGLSIGLTYPFKRNVSAEQRRFCAEAVFSYILNSLKEKVSAAIKPKKLVFDYAAPPYSAEYEEHFQCKAQFDSPMAIMVLDESWLYRDISSYDPTLHQLYLNKSLDAWQKSERLQDFEYRTIGLLMRDHPESFNSQKLAAKLSISVRGLQKRLNKQGESFSHLANLARRELAKIYLFQMEQSIDYTAEQLGFQTTSGFRRFFKAEFDLTPFEFINQFDLTNKVEDYADQAR